MRTILCRFVVMLGLLTMSYQTPSPAPAAENSGDAPDDEIVIRQALGIARVGRSGRNPIHLDPIEKRIVEGDWTAPQEGDSVVGYDGETRTWEKLEAAENGVFQKHPALRGGYVYAEVNTDADRTMILRASGHSAVYANGKLRVGDPYKFGYVQLPVHLKKGVNTFLFLCGRGSLGVRLTPVDKPVFFPRYDNTFPDLIVGEATDAFCGSVVVNCTDAALNGYSIVSRLESESWDSLAQQKRTPLTNILPMTVRKVGFEIVGPAPIVSGRTTLTLQLVDNNNELVDETQFALNVRNPGDNHKRTFISKMDGSVQYYAVNPADPIPGVSPERPALFLSLHGASVEAAGQANSYSAKTWGDIVAPTNRRPYGFDWEEWGRIDAMEVLALAKKRFQPNPTRIYLTGHSMGGHGTWHIGTTYPDQFGAIAPSAGWRTFRTYSSARGAGFEASAMEKMMRRAANTSDIISSLTLNLKQLGVYIVHGSADDNVPVREAREMVKLLSTFHHDFYYHEQPGAGHWWNSSDEPGASCVDWPGIFDFFARHTRPTNETARHVLFYTANPGVSAKSHWIAIEAQEHPLELSFVDFRYDPWKRRYVGTTHNVSRVKFDVSGMIPAETLQVDIDGDKIADIPWPEAGDSIRLGREDEASSWTLQQGPTGSLKGPKRYGPFKEALTHDVLFVYGTRGEEEENAWAFAKARYDAEQFWYRGNGAIEVIADVEYTDFMSSDRDVVLYGNADTNAAWDDLLGDSPVQLTSGQARIGERKVKGENLASLFIRPRADSDVACVAVVGGTGIVGMRLTDRLPYFVSGVAYPDVTLMTPETLADGLDGVVCAGFFGVDWSVESGEFAWRD